jgi:hypothetical protein
MIDLNHAQEQMLAEIKASAKAFVNCLRDPADPGFVVLDEAYLMVQGETPHELLAVLNAAFTERYADVPPQQLSRDLLYLLKKGLGNAYKWGNHKDPTKRITVEIVATQTGVLITISDEGEGFDVQGIVGQFRSGERHFTHGGSGFRHFEKSPSLISYADGGRTLLIRFLCVPEPGKTITTAASPAFRTAGNRELTATARAFTENTVRTLI